MRINKTWFGYEIKRTLKSGIVETMTINTCGAGRVRSVLALLFALIGNYEMVDYIIIGH